MKHIHTTRFWIVLLSAAFALCAGLALLLAGSTGGRTVARIAVDGQTLREIDLSAATGAFEFEVETPYGVNTVAVRPGGIRVIRADCPDQVCVNQGWLEGGVTPVVCLPHRLVISLICGADPGALDAVAG